MTPSPVEEGARVATGVIEGLKDQPLSLALVAMNVIFVLLVAWLAYSFNIRTTEQYHIKDALIAKLIDKCRDDGTSGLTPSK
jgi:hypothetical protein